MLPILFSETATSWNTFGIGVLIDTLSCEVEENRNGSYELEMEYPITGAFFKEIALRRLIVAKPNYTDKAQPFRIYKISKPLNGIVTILAQHISYDLSGYIDAPFTASGIQGTMVQMLDPGTILPAGCPFSFSSNMSNTDTVTLKHPESVRALMGGVEGSLVDVFGGEWKFDGYDCILNSARGANRGVLIRYGKNLTDLRQEENNASVYTAVYPYYYSEDTDTLVTLTEKTLAVSGTFNYTRILKLDLSTEFQEPPTEAQLRERALRYISSNSIGVPNVNLTVGFIQLDSLDERVDLCDTVNIAFDDLGVSATAKCIRTRWDVLQERYIEAEFGSARNTLASTIIGIEEETEKANIRATQYAGNVGIIAADVAESIVKTVVGAEGGYVILHDTDNDGKPNELLIMNTQDISTATKIIRINNDGIAFSKTGYNGTYSTAWNIDGQFVADFIASGTIATNQVVIRGDTYFWWDAANITIRNPSNANQMIRLGKYDGTNYGLGFSVDGGATWVSGFDFNGITMIKNVSSTYCKMQIDGAGITFTDANGEVYMYLGTGTVKNASGSSVTGSYFRFGTFASGVVPGLLSLAAGADNSPTGAYSVALGNGNTASGLNAVAEGRGSTASGDYAVALGYNNNAKGTRSFAAGQDNTCETNAPRGVAIGVGNTVSDASMQAGGGVAIGAYNSATAMQAAALGGNGNTAAHPMSVCLGGTGNTTTRTAQVVMGTQASPGSRDVLVVGNNGNVMSLDQNGNLTIIGQLNQNSDRRLKLINGDIPDVSEIKAVRFRWNRENPNQDDREHFGYIAQDVEAVAPSLVSEDGNGFKTLNYIELLCAKVEHLERKVGELTVRLAELEASNG